MIQCRLIYTFVCTCCFRFVSSTVCMCIVIISMSLIIYSDICCVSAFQFLCIEKNEYPHSLSLDLLFWFYVWEILLFDMAFQFLCIKKECPIIRYFHYLVWENGFQLAFCFLCVENENWDWDFGLYVWKNDFLIYLLDSCKTSLRFIISNLMIGKNEHMHSQLHFINIHGLNSYSIVLFSVEHASERDK